MRRFFTQTGSHPEIKGAFHSSGPQSEDQLSPEVAALLDKPGITKVVIIYDHGLGERVCVIQPMPEPSKAPEKPTGTLLSRLLNEKPDEWDLVESLGSAGDLRHTPSGLVVGWDSSMNREGASILRATCGHDTATYDDAETRRAFSDRLNLKASLRRADLASRAGNMRDVLERVYQRYLNDPKETP